MDTCLEQGAYLHLAQLMPLPLTVSCFSKIKIGSTFLVPAHLGSPGKKAVKSVCVLGRPHLLTLALVSLTVVPAVAWLQLLKSLLKILWTKLKLQNELKYTNTLISNHLGHGSVHHVDYWSRHVPRGRCHLAPPLVLPYVHPPVTNQHSALATDSSSSE